MLDDATSAIDVQVEARILEALAQRLHGRTTLLIGHRESTLRLADRVLLMENGKIVASGTHLALMQTEPRYAAVLALGATEHKADKLKPRAPQRPAMAAGMGDMIGGGLGGAGGPLGGFNP